MASYLNLQLYYFPLFFPSVNLLPLRNNLLQLRKYMKLLILSGSSQFSVKRCNFGIYQNKIDFPATHQLRVFSKFYLKS